MLQAIVGVATENVQPLAGADVPVTLLLDLRKHPRLDEGTPAITEQSNTTMRQTGNPWLPMLTLLSCTLPLHCIHGTRCNPHTTTRHHYLQYSIEERSKVNNPPCLQIWKSFTKHGHGICCLHAGLDVVPVSKFCVALLPGPSMDLHMHDHTISYL